MLGSARWSIGLPISLHGDDGAPREQVDQQAGHSGRGDVVVTESGDGKYAQTINVGRHWLRADEPPSAGGDDSGPSPYQLLSGSFGACTSMTLRMYADHKK